MEIAIIGGTTFLGPHLTRALAERGHAVTLFNRGSQEAPTGYSARTVLGDRRHDLARLGGRTWDAVIDTCGYFPNDVALSARFFAERAQHYLFVSTVSVYDMSVAGVTENTPHLPLPDTADATQMDGATYGPLKSACEAIVTSTYRHRAIVLRPGLIVGPYDPTDRFTYWPARIARGGNVLVPPAETPVQFIDVRDVATFSTALLERGASGEFNVTGNPGEFTIGDVAATCKHVSGSNARFVHASNAFLAEHEVAEWMDLPLWIPPSSGLPGMTSVNISKAVAAGLSVRPLEQTVRDTLAWSQTRSEDHEPKAGLTTQRETELLAKLR